MDCYAASNPDRKDFSNDFSMSTLLRKTITHPALAIGSALLWGLVEAIALQRARWTTSSRSRRNG
jgi:hypothetical protein